MEAIKLRIDNWFIKWTNICVEWFMNFFADPDYYWVEESYPEVGTQKTINRDSSEVANKGHINVSKISSLKGKVLKNRIIKKVYKKVVVQPVRKTNVQSMITTLVRSLLFNSSIVFRPFQFVYIWDKLKYNVSNSM